MALKTPQPTPAELATLCLIHLAEDHDQLGDFMALTGLSPDEFRRAVGTPSFSQGLIDYVVQHEQLLLAICAANNMLPETVMRVWAKLNPAG